MPPSSPIDRRQALQLVVAAALLPACGGSVAAPGAPDGGAAPAVDAGTSPDAAPGAPDAGPVDAGAPVPPLDPSGLPASTKFPIGLTSGDPGPDRIALASLWQGQGELQLRVWKDDGSVAGVAVVAQAAAVGEGGMVGVELTGLEPGTRYRWVLLEVEAGAPKARSPLAVFKTAPALSESPRLRFAAVACTSNRLPKTSLERAAAEGPYDAFLLLGDTTYNDGARSLADFRGKWRESLASDGWTAMRLQTAVVATWDDHEIDNDFNPETTDAQVLANARRTFFEHVPMRRTAPDRIWRKLSFGRTADVFVLDTRGERKPSTRGSANPIYVSREQMDWLKRELEASPARFKLLMNSVPITDFPGFFDAAANDRWEGYAAQRTEILQFIDSKRIGGVLWVSGDFHMASVGRVSNSGAGATQTEILVGPGAQVGNPLALSARAPQFDWASSTSNTTLLDLDPAAGTIRCVWRGANGVLRDQTLSL
jgi:alkaline phosphatase D